MRRPPQYVNGFIDRHGKARWYFRRAGFKKAPLPGLPWSPEFMAAYERALAGQPAPIGAERTIPGTLRALAVSYLASPAFRTTRPSTQSTYRGVIDRLCIEHGDKRVALLQRERRRDLRLPAENRPRGLGACTWDAGADPRKSVQQSNLPSNGPGKALHGRRIWQLVP